MLNISKSEGQKAERQTDKYTEIITDLWTDR